MARGPSAIIVLPEGKTLITQLIKFRLFPFRSPLLREYQLIYFPSATKMFQFTEYSSPYSIYSNKGHPDISQDGFPHSEIFGSKVACHLTEAYRRLLRPSSSS